jgi:hypothetical protein
MSHQRTGRISGCSGPSTVFPRRDRVRPGGENATVTGKSPHGGTASVQFTLPTGKVTAGSAAIGLNNHYTVTVAHAPKGATKVEVFVRGKLIQTVVVHGYPAPAPTVSSLSTHAGPAAGRDQGRRSERAHWAIGIQLPEQPGPHDARARGRADRGRHDRHDLRGRFRLRQVRVLRFDLGPFTPAVCTVMTGMRGREMALSGWTSQPRSGRDAPADAPFP